MKSTLIKSALASTALLAFTLSAGAADLPPRPYYKNPVRSVVPYQSWQGFYVGVNGGWGSSKVSWEFTGVGTTADHTGNGYLLGGTLGYNYQINNWVVGLEGDWDWANIKGSTSCPNPAFTCGTTVNSIGTIRGRVGYAWNSLLLYGTAGYAFGNVKVEITGPTSGSQTQMAGGLVYGAGLEYAFLGNWSAKVEYLRADLGTKTYDLSPVTASLIDAKAPVQMIRAGVNYKFNGPIFSRF
jgi:outer membrane immunogenic protein